ncbi:hotdog fold thioesterase [Amphritea balenae]|uniref:Hotdog fold thioesterase n=1 Tax=Amphritea balenae TaxID=452629 RepID=A0A3P1SJ34_9GAMM|nr:hotdog fold thioesterase [Amphritea balenae]RRC97034.1 hotdog fold thioesterase [Amphritea balenae]GGK67469.1 4-hydroxybenzoyl-CoA thioesterase [Amphritea balenae]
MSIWKTEMSVAQLQAFMKNTLVEHLGIEISEIGSDYIRATMPVDPRTHQPMGILHGGASVVLAESLGSMAAQLAAEPGHPCVGLEINANHLASIRTGSVTGTARPVHIGRSTQVWDIRIEDDNGKAICVSRLTMSVLSN